MVSFCLADYKKLGARILRHREFTFVDAVLRDVDVNSSLNSSALDVLQLLHSLFAHMLQLADMIIHIGDLNFASCSCAPCGHLKGSNSHGSENMSNAPAYCCSPSGLEPCMI